MVVTDDRQLRRELGDWSDDLGTQDRVAVHDRPLVLGQLVCLQQDVIRHPDLAYVVEQAAPLEGLHVGLSESHHRADVARDLHHPPAVLAGERVSLVDSLSERTDRLGEHLTHLDVLLECRSGRVERDPKDHRCPDTCPIRQQVDLRHEPRERRQGKLVAEELLGIARQNQPEVQLAEKADACCVDQQIHEDHDGATSECRKERNHAVVVEVGQELVHERTEDRRQDNPCVIEERSVPRDPALQFSKLGGSDGGNPTGRHRTTEDRRGDNGGHRHGHDRAPRHANWRCRRNERQEGPEAQPRDHPEFCCWAEHRDRRVHPEDVAGPLYVDKARDCKCKRTRRHEPSHV